ncbi:MAG: hypothetical protein U5N55_11945 [Cypionkella sp.]|nr:hypothetical protein [Cypionkella sp.]
MTTQIITVPAWHDPARAMENDAALAGCSPLFCGATATSTDAVLRDACDVMRALGDTTDHLQADVMTQALDWQARHPVGQDDALHFDTRVIATAAWCSGIATIFLALVTGYIIATI